MLAQGSQTPLYAQLYAGYREQLLRCTTLPASVSPWEALHGDMAKEVSLVEGKEGWMGRSFLPACWQREDAGWEHPNSANWGCGDASPSPDSPPCTEGTTVLTFSLLHVLLLITPCCMYDKILFFLLNE